MAVNRRWVLAERPEGGPGAAVFRQEEGAIPEPGPGEMLVRNIYIPVDPGMRPRLSASAIGVEEFEPLSLGETVGYMTAGRVVKSRADGFAEGDWVTDMLLWQDYAVTTPATARRLGQGSPHPTDLIGILGIPGLSAWYGLGALGDAKAGETVLITSAAGTVGAIAGQIAKMIGCRVVGIAGGGAKMRYLTEELGFDAAVDHRRDGDLREQLALAAPEGFDVLFDNVGNSMIEVALPLMRTHGRIVICGQTAHYGGETPGIFSTASFVPRRLTMQGLFVHDFAEDFPNALEMLAGWRRDGRITLRETIVDGFDQLPAVFAELFTGENRVGKTIVRIDGAGK